MARRPLPLLAAVALVAVSLPPTATVAVPARTPGTVATAPGVAPAVVLPSLRVTPLVRGLTNPWDLAFAPNGVLLFTERPGRVRVRLANGTVRTLVADQRDLWVSGETGLMAIETDPAFATNRRVYTCQGTTDNARTVQVVAWTVDTAYTRLTRVKDPLVGGIDGSTGRHGGCQLRFDRAGNLYVGTGDAATGTNPQNLRSLAGKVLRVNRFTGAGVPGNLVGGDPRILTFGHRNVQGLVRTAAGDIYEVEHGTDRDDEINKLMAGRNYGWSPVPGYDETRPMTDLVRFPTAVPARWRSGFPTVATSGATFIRDPRWGYYDYGIAVATLKGSQLRIYKIITTRVALSAIPPELNRTFGRLRGAEFGPDGALYVTTSNATAATPGVDLVLRVTPR